MQLRNNEALREAPEQTDRLKDVSTSFFFVAIVSIVLFNWEIELRFVMTTMKSGQRAVTGVC